MASNELFRKSKGSLSDTHAHTLNMEEKDNLRGNERTSLGISIFSYGIGC